MRMSWVLNLPILRNVTSHQTGNYITTYNLNIKIAFFVGNCLITSSKTRSPFVCYLHGFSKTNSGFYISSHKQQRKTGLL